MTIHIKTLKVRQRKAAQTVMCAPQLQAMLGCWAATQDLHSIDKCKGAADGLFQCMRTTAAARTLGELKSFKFYVDVNGTTRASYSQFRSELKFAGVTIVDTASEGREGSPAKMVLTDTFVYALDNPAPQKVLLVSGDPDLCYGISLLRLRGYQVYLLGPSGSSRNLSHFHGNFEFDGSLFAEDDRSPSPPKSPPNGHAPISKPHFGSTGLPPRPMKAPSSGGHDRPNESVNVLAPSEIEEFRQKFSTTKPTLDTTLNPFAPPFGGGSHSTVPSWGVGPQPGGLTQAVPKGKEKARDSPLQSPGISPASSISSRSNSFDSYVMPPSVSTAPTSAIPFHQSDFKAGGDLKYQGLLFSTLRAPAPLSATITQQVERTVSAGSTDSEIATVIASRPASAAPPIPSRPVTPAPPPAPERIQVRASLPFGTPTQTPMIPPQIPFSVLSAPRPRVPPPVPSVPQAASVVVAAPQPRAVITPTPLVASLAPNTPRQTQVVPPAAAAPASTQATTILPAATSSSTSANTPSNSLDGVAPHFQHLIHILRDFRSRGVASAAREGVFPLLLKRDRNFMVAAGTAKYKKPFALYLEDAHEAGVITSPTGKVELAPRYR
ncbi:hypothetical protein EST38_g9979 [Candolleomyces aberdarensis]|uniref:NYN domain-containing protein n=1 Tax=Candolleomyces aberdarensis TaxID=2316362 RepID=A0A4Q2DAZ7_9AGAR|nr:hypothetical protein EST38_g9979 [Candolleomyces aberdarensis]